MFAAPDPGVAHSPEHRKMLPTGFMCQNILLVDVDLVVWYHLGNIPPG